MKKVFKNYLTFIESLPEYHQFWKMYIAEHYALWKKRKLINSVHWNDSQKKDFNSYWKKNYKKINTKGTKLLQFFNEEFHVDYMPDFLYASKVESKLNLYSHAKVYSDKSLTEILYKGKSEAILPHTYLLNAGGVFYDSERNVIDRSQAKIILLNIKEAVVKPILDGNSGKGVIIGSFDENAYDDNNKFDLLSLLDKSEKNYIIQEKVKQSEELNKLFPHSINTFRVITYISDSKIKAAPLSLRLGSGLNKLDNIHAGGLVIGVNIENETLLQNAYKLGYSDSNLKFEKHPDTHTIFYDYKVKGVNKIISAAKKLHVQTPHIGIISWDFTLNLDNNPILIEANYLGQSMWFPQIVNKQPIFQNNTNEILNLIR